MSSVVSDKVEGDTSTVEVLKRIKDAFDIFDHECNKTVDVREIGTIVRSLNCCPTEGELSDILTSVEEDEPTGYIRYEKFEPVMMRILLERKYKAASEEKLLKAFELLDIEQNEYLSVDDVQSLMTKEGEPFTQEEMDEMLSAAVDPDKGSVYYKDYVTLMAVDDSFW